jgi:hypothetical protein
VNESLEEARELALQKIGRNLVNLQKLEGMLKQLLATHDLQGHPSTLASSAKRKADKASKMTLGQVIRELGATLFEHSSVFQGRLELSDEPWLSAKLTLEGGAEVANQWQGDMSMIVAARNDLVHHMLVSFDPNSIDSCKALSAALDTQREQLLPILEHVRSLVLAQKEALEDIQRDLDAPGS